MRGRSSDLHSLSVDERRAILVSGMDAALKRSFPEGRVTLETLAPIPMYAMSRGWPMSVKLAREKVNSYEGEEVRTEIARILDYLCQVGNSWTSKTSVDFLERIDKEAMNKMFAHIPKYIELKH